MGAYVFLSILKDVYFSNQHSKLSTQHSALREGLLKNGLITDIARKGQGGSTLAQIFLEPFLWSYILGQHDSTAPVYTKFNCEYCKFEKITEKRVK